MGSNKMTPVCERPHHTMHQNNNSSHDGLFYPLDITTVILDHYKHWQNNILHYFLEVQGRYLRTKNKSFILVVPNILGAQ